VYMNYENHKSREMVFMEDSLSVRNNLDMHPSMRIEGAMVCYGQIFQIIFV